jgi:hypothetical protein
MASKLNLKVFADAFVANGGNKMEAAKAAGSKATSPQSLSQVGVTLYKKAEAAGLIEKRVEKVLKRIGAEEVIEGLANQARADMGKFITVSEDGKTFEWNLKDAPTRLIKKLKKDPTTGEPIMELVDSQGALDKLAKILGLNKEDQKPQVTINALLTGGDAGRLGDVYRGLLGAAGQVVEAEVVKEEEE